MDLSWDPKTLGKEADEDEEKKPVFHVEGYSEYCEIHLRNGLRRS